jgi:hypothetical protein
MLTRANFPNITKRTVELRETIAQLKTGVLVLAWFDRAHGMQIWPVDDESAVRPDTPIYQVRGPREVAAYIAARDLLDSGNEDGAYACLAAEVADENTYQLPPEHWANLQ